MNTQRIKKILPFLFVSAFFLFIGALQVHALTSTFDIGTDPADGGSLSSGTNAPSRSTTTPSATVACPAPGQLNTITDFINYLTCLLGRALVPLVFALALLTFVWGVVKYVIAAKDSNEREEGRMFMIYGIIALFVMISVWGLVAVLSNTFQIGSSFPPQFR
jgi:hypothetical protein